MNKHPNDLATVRIIVGVMLICPSIVVFLWSFFKGCVLLKAMGRLYNEPYLLLVSIEMMMIGGLISWVLIIVGVFLIAWDWLDLGRNAASSTPVFGRE